MLRFYSCLLLALASTLAFAANLKGNLTAAGITAVFPGDPSYVTASTACTSLLTSLYFTLM